MISKLKWAVKGGRIGRNPFSATDKQLIRIWSAYQLLIVPITIKCLV